MYSWMSANLPALDCWICPQSMIVSGTVPCQLESWSGHGATSDLRNEIQRWKLSEPLSFLVWESQLHYEGYSWGFHGVTGGPDLEDPGRVQKFGSGANNGSCLDGGWALGFVLWWLLEKMLPIPSHPGFVKGEPSVSPRQSWNSGSNGVT